MLQAGTEADSSCANGVSTASYYAWYQWSPADPMIITNLPVAAGDDVETYVWNDDPTHGHAYIVNVGTGDFVNLQLSAPSGTQLVGDSAEWIVESPTSGQGASNGVSIANYGQEFMSTAYATTHAGATSSPGNPGTNSLVTVSLCDETCYNVLSTVAMNGPASLEFTATGMALDDKPLVARAPAR